MFDVIKDRNRLDFVKAELARYQGLKRDQGDRVFVCCPFHAEKTPSGAIWTKPRSAGLFKCFGCGASATWNEVAPKLGLNPFVQGPPKEEKSVDLLMDRAYEELVEDSDGYEAGRFKYSPIPRGKRWRDIPTDLLIELGGQVCRKWSDEYKRWGSTKFIYMPVMVNGEQRGYFLARLKKHPDYPSYLLAKAKGHSKWSLNYGLWPFNHAIRMMEKQDSRSIVLVEGQRDALRLISAGIPAMCIFGTQSWTEHKSKMLELAGVRNVILLMDGDCAGIAATKKIKPECRKWFTVTAIKLWAIKGSPWLQFRNEDEPSKKAKEAGVSLWDPGNMPQWVVKALKRKFF